MEIVCNAKKANRPRALHAAQDGFPIRGNVVIVPDQQSVCCNVDVPSTPPPPPGTVYEKFFADTGANRSIHPNGRSASSFYRVSLDISTASAGKSMRSEGVGWF